MSQDKPRGATPRLARDQIRQSDRDDGQGDPGRASRSRPRHARRPRHEAAFGGAGVASEAHLTLGADAVPSGPVGFAAITRTRFGDQAYATLLHKIVTGDIPEGGAPPTARGRLMARDTIPVTLELGCKSRARRRLVHPGEGPARHQCPAGGLDVPPVLIGKVPSDHRLAREEIFGPVLVENHVTDEAEGPRVANGTPYGLAAGVRTSDLGRAMRLAKGIQSGQVFINNYGAGGGVELPVGGVKGSDHGREKGFEALDGFAAMKMVSINHGV